MAISAWPSLSNSDLKWAMVEYGQFTVSFLAVWTFLAITKFEM